MATFIIISYSIIGLFFAREFKKLFRAYRPEIRLSHGKRKVYLRERKTGRLVACSNNPFTLLILVA